MRKKNKAKKSVYFYSRKHLAKQFEKTHYQYQEVLENIEESARDFDDIWVFVDLIWDINVSRKTTNREFNETIGELYDKYEVLRKEVNLLGEILAKISDNQNMMNELKA